MKEIFLGKLPVMVQGEEPLGEELIAKLEQYALDKKLPAYEVVTNSDGNSVAQQLTK